MKKLVGVFVVMMTIGMSLTARAADDVHKLEARLTAAKATLDEIMSVPDKAVPDGIARKAVCVGVVPGMVKGAFILGAEYGQGVVTCRTGAGWSAPVFIRMAGGSFGFQAGGQGTDLVLVAINEKGFQDLLHDKFKIGGDASAAARYAPAHASPPCRRARSAHGRESNGPDDRATKRPIPRLPPQRPARPPA